MFFFSLFYENPVIGKYCDLSLIRTSCRLNVTLKTKKLCPLFGAKTKFSNNKLKKNVFLDEGSTNGIRSYLKLDLLRYFKIS